MCFLKCSDLNPNLKFRIFGRHNLFGSQILDVIQNLDRFYVIYKSVALHVWWHVVAFSGKKNDRQMKRRPETKKIKLMKTSCHNFLVWTGIMKAVKSSESNFSDHVTWVSFRPILLIDTLLIWHSFARNIPTLVVPSTIIIHISCQFIFLFTKAPPHPQKKKTRI